MQGILIFDLSDPDERRAHTRATKADTCYSLLWKLINDDDEGKRLLKIKSIEELRRELYILYNECGICPDEEY